MLQPDLLTCGDVIIVTLPAHTPKGHEQQGTRPAVVVGIPLREIRYPMFIGLKLRVIFFPLEVVQSQKSIVQKLRFFDA